MEPPEFPESGDDQRMRYDRVHPMHEDEDDGPLISLRKILSIIVNLRAVYLLIIGGILGGVSMFYYIDRTLLRAMKQNYTAVEKQYNEVSRLHREEIARRAVLCKTEQQIFKKSVQEAIDILREKKDPLWDTCSSANIALFLTSARTIEGSNRWLF